MLSCGRSKHTQPYAQHISERHQACDLTADKHRLNHFHEFAGFILIGKSVSIGDAQEPQDVGCGSQIRGHLHRMVGPPAKTAYARKEEQESLGK